MGSNYDYRTRRISTYENEKRTYYRYDGGVSFDQLNGETGAVDVTFTRAGGMGGGIGSILYNSKGEYFTNNAVGHTVALTDAAGAVTRTDLYEAFGSIVSSTGASDNKHLANTKERDFSTGLDNHGFRYYDRELGRYTSRDPIGYRDGMNVFSYVHHNPVNSIDPVGLTAEMVGVVYEAVDTQTGEGLIFDPKKFENYNGKGPVRFRQRINTAHGQYEFLSRKSVRITVREVWADIPDTDAAARKMGFKGGIEQARRRAVAVIEQDRIDYHGGAKSQVREMRAKGVIINSKSRNKIRAAGPKRYTSGLKVKPRIGKSFVVKKSNMTWKQSLKAMSKVEKQLVNRSKSPSVKARMGKTLNGGLFAFMVVGMLVESIDQGMAMHEAQEQNDMRIWFAKNAGVPKEFVSFDNPSFANAFKGLYGHAMNKIDEKARGKAKELFLTYSNPGETSSFTFQNGAIFAVNTKLQFTRGKEVSYARIARLVRVPFGLNVYLEGHESPIFYENESKIGKYTPGKPE